jgi:hypothetical protein
MNVAGAARLFGHNALWRTMGWYSAGRALLDALNSPDEDLRTLAGMFLVQSGRKAEPLLEEALAKRQNLPLVLTILGDLGNPRYEPELRRFSDDPDPLVATAARSALRVLKAHSGIG